MPGVYVNVTGTSKGRGFAGVVRRWNFRGGPKTHGQSDRHRAPGSIGAGTTPGRVWKGQKMGGHMGARHPDRPQPARRVRRSRCRHLVFIEGSVAGAKQRDRLRRYARSQEAAALTTKPPVLDFVELPEDCRWSRNPRTLIAEPEAESDAASEVGR